MHADRNGCSGCISSTIATGVIFSISLVLLIFVQFEYSAFHVISHSKLFKKIFLFSDFQSIPDTFMVDSSYILPNFNYQTYGTTLYLLESFYKHQGIKTNMLNADEYLLLSEKSLFFLSQTNPEIKKLKSSVLNGSPKDLIKLPAFQKYILPKSICPEYGNEEQNTSKNCNFDKHIARNPLKFFIRSESFKKGVNGIKRLLFEKHHPLPLTLPVPENVYMFSCSNKIIKELNHEICGKKYYPCKSNNKENEHCLPVHFSHNEKNESDLYYSINDNIYPGDSHSVVLVGYNDNYIINKNYDKFISQSKINKGGFIVVNSKLQYGHSIEYLMGLIDDRKEKDICPVTYAKNHFMPVDIDCIKTKNNIDLCSDGMDDNITIFQCINETHCELNKLYLLMKENSLFSILPTIFNDQNDVPIPIMIKYERLDALTSKIEVVNISTLPFNFLNLAFKRVENNKYFKLKNSDRCSFSFLPYNTLEKLYKRRNKFSSDIFATDFNIKWTTESYSRSGSSNDYTHIIKSTEYIDIETNDKVQQLIDFEDKIY